MYKIFLGFSLSALLAACTGSANRPSAPTPKPENFPVAKKFAYPIGKSETVTQAKDNDEWYNATEFRQDNHLGEDWNLNTGGNTDCGEPVYSMADGVVTYAGDAGPGWGNVVIIEHRMSDGKKVQSLYGHMQKIDKAAGTVKFREKIGEVGNANGKYLCHLHFEIRDESCPSWNQVFVGYSPVAPGWLDPSDFIDGKRKLSTDAHR